MVTGRHRRCRIYNLKRTKLTICPGRPRFSTMSNEEMKELAIALMFTLAPRVLLTAIAHSPTCGSMIRITTIPGSLRMSTFSPGSSNKLLPSGLEILATLMLVFLGGAGITIEIMSIVIVSSTNA